MTVNVEDKATTPSDLWFYQKQHIFKPGFYGWQVIGFAAGILGGNYYLANYFFPKPAGGPVIFNVNENDVLKTFLFHAAILFFKTLAIPWIVVYFMCENNSCTKNPEDIGTGVGPITRNDPIKERFNRIHNNDLENVPFMLLMGYFMVLVNPDPDTAALLFKINTGARFLHTVWYSIAGSHEVRAVLYSINVFCMVAYTFQMLIGIGVM